MSETSKEANQVKAEIEVSQGIYKAIENFISRIPKTNEIKSEKPLERARLLANTAAAKAALVSGGLALPPGPLGLLTIVPDLIAIWKIQGQMVADIAGAFGKKVFLTREQMIYCLFRHAASQLVRDLIVRSGERVLIRRLSMKMIQPILNRIGVRTTQRLAKQAVVRWLPLIGALGVGAYAYYDTAQVAKTAIELFQKEIDIIDV